MYRSATTAALLLSCCSAAWSQDGMKFSKLGGPTLDTPVTTIAQLFPAGAWKTDSGIYFEYKASFEGVGYVSRFFRAGGGSNKFARMEIKFSELWERQSGDYSNYNSGSVAKVEDLCGPKYSAILSAVIESAGPPIDNPIIQKRSASDEISCSSQLRSCEVGGNITITKLVFRNAPHEGTLIKREANFSKATENWSKKSVFNQRRGCEITLEVR
jgi:hypothetical protein